MSARREQKSYQRERMRGAAQLLDLSQPRYLWAVAPPALAGVGIIVPHASRV
jgi:hypothetical protein